MTSFQKFRKNNSQNKMSGTHIWVVLISKWFTNEYHMCLVFFQLSEKYSRFRLADLLRSRLFKLNNSQTELYYAHCEFIDFIFSSRLIFRLCKLNFYIKKNSTQMYVHIAHLKRVRASSKETGKIKMNYSIPWNLKQY